MKDKKRKQKLNSRIKDYELMKKTKEQGYNKPGSQKK